VPTARTGGEAAAMGEKGTADTRLLAEGPRHRRRR